MGFRLAANLGTYIVAGFLVAIACASGLETAHAQQSVASNYPSKPVHFVVPVPPGAGADVHTRFLARKFTELTGQPTIVDNRAGANGFIGVNAVMSAPADGYTVLMGSNSTLATNAALFKRLPYDPLKDLVPVSTLMHSPIVLVVSANSPFKTLEELVGSAKTNPGQRTVSVGTAAYQLMGELFAEKAGIKLLMVPYKGGLEAINATMGAQTDLCIVEISAALELLRAGKLRALAVATDERIEALPDVPTAREKKIMGFTADIWTGVAVRSGTPQPIVDKLSSVFVQILAMPETRTFYQRQNMIPAKGGEDELRKLQHDQIEIWKAIATTAKIELQ